MREGSSELEGLHRRARARGERRASYTLARALLGPPMRLWFRLRVGGAEHVPSAGAAIIAPNHKSFFDAFFVALATPRQVRFMAKTELFPRSFGRLLVALGAFPVRRGEADVEAMATARAILEQGGVVVIFPEGTRVEDRDALGSPHRGAGRLALATGAPIVPAAIAGTERMWLGPIARPRRVQLTFLPPVDPRALADAVDPAGELMDDHVWPAVRREYGNLLTRPGVLLAALTALGLGAGLAARRQGRARTRLLGVVPPGNVRRREARHRRRERLCRPRVTRHR